MIFLEQRIVDDRVQRLMISLCQEHECFCIPLWRLHDAFPIGVLADALDYCSYGSTEPLQSVCCLLWVLVFFYSIHCTLGGPSETYSIDCRPFVTILAPCN